MKGFYKTKTLGVNYLINKKGELYSVPRISSKGGLIKSYKGKYYLYYPVTIDGKRKHVTIHRLLAETFIPNPDNKKEVTHIDGNPLNNSLINLKWVTKEERIKLTKTRITIIETNLNGMKSFVLYDNKTKKVINDNNGNGFKTYNAAYHAFHFRNSTAFMVKKNNTVLVNDWKDNNPKIINEINYYINVYKTDLKQSSMSMNEIFEIVESETNVKIPKNIKNGWTNIYV